MQEHVVVPAVGRFVALAAALALTLAACAPAPLYKTDSPAATVTPASVAAAPDRYAGHEVVWGGRIVGVRNFPDHSEIELLGYPLDSSQRPRFDQEAGGRFIVLMPGYVEGMDYQTGTPMTVLGDIQGVRNGKVGDADYVFPLVAVKQSHRWTPEEMSKPRVSFGVGVGVVGGFH